MRQVACPVALHPDGTPRRIAIFEHPLAGLQLPKGGIKTGEHPSPAAARELFEESGLETTSAILMGDSTDIHEGEHWHFALCRIKPPVRDHWQHFCADDGGHLLKFRWMPLDLVPPDGFHPKFMRALDWIKGTL